MLLFSLFLIGGLFLLVGGAQVMIRGATRSGKSFLYPARRNWPNDGSFRDKRARTRCELHCRLSSTQSTTARVCPGGLI